jgi:hypothetical protein
MIVAAEVIIETTPINVMSFIIFSSFFMMLGY